MSLPGGNLVDGLPPVEHALWPEHMWGKWTLVRRFLLLLLYDLAGTPKLAGRIITSCRMKFHCDPCTW